MNKENLEIYVHIPFCIRKCGYCDFLSYSSGEASQKEYVKALMEEIDGVEGVEDYQVVSVFFGGGTPSILEAEDLTSILYKIKSKISFTSDAEISLEANPGTVTAKKLELYRKAGFNRISFGCQSMDNKELVQLGRIHTVEEFLEGYHQARKSGFSNINVDLMSGLPGQNYEDWERNLRMTAELRPEHISAYSLILEEGTPFYQKQDLLDFPDEETERLMYEKTHEVLEEYGYEQYEISNYAKKGYECRHNIGYWKRVPYLGLGLGSASLMEECRYSNTTDWKNYLEHSKNPRTIRKDVQELTVEDAIEEFMILGLRMCRGVSEEDFRQRFKREVSEVYGGVIDKYSKLGFMQKKEGNISFTRAGISVSNTILTEFLRD